MPDAVASRRDEGEEDMSKTIACGDLVSGCPFKAEAATESELMTKVAEHAAHAHGVKEVTPELAAQVKAAIRTA
jgi:predicted small metal-binding protein